MQEILVRFVVVYLLSHVQLFCDPMDCIGCWAPLSMGFSRQQYWSGFPFPGDLPGPGMESESPALTGGFFTTEPPGRPICKIVVAVQSLSRV